MSIPVRQILPLPRNVEAPQQPTETPIRKQPKMESSSNDLPHSVTELRDLSLGGSTWSPVTTRPSPAAFRPVICSPAPKMEGQDDAANSHETSLALTVRSEAPLQSRSERPTSCIYMGVCHYSAYPNGAKVLFHDLPSFEEDKNATSIPYNAYRWSFGDSITVYSEVECDVFVLKLRRQLFDWLKKHDFTLDLIKRCNVSIHVVDRFCRVMDIHWPSLSSGAPDLRPLSGPIFDPEIADVAIEYKGHGPRCAPYEIAIKVVLECDTNILHFKDTFNTILAPFGATIVDIWRLMLLDQYMSTADRIMDLESAAQWNGTLILLVALSDCSSPTFERPSPDPAHSASQLPDSIKFHGESIHLRQRQRKAFNQICLDFPIKGNTGDKSNSILHIQTNADTRRSLEVQTAKRLSTFELAIHQPLGGNDFAKRSST